MVESSGLREGGSREELRRHKDRTEEDDKDPRRGPAQQGRGDGGGVGVHAGDDVIEGGEPRGELRGLGAEDGVLGVDTANSIQRQGRRRARGAAGAATAAAPQTDSTAEDSLEKDWVCR